MPLFKLISLDFQPQEQYSTSKIETSFSLGNIVEFMKKFSFTGVSTILAFLFVMTVSACSSMHEDIAPDTEIVHSGDPLPQFTVTLNDGSIVSTQSLLGSPAIIIFFNTTCKDCQHELPILNEQFLTEMSKYDELEISADKNNQTQPLRPRQWICIAREESAESIQDYWKKHNLSLPWSAQPDRNIYNLFATSGIPRVYNIGPDGRIR